MMKKISLILITTFFMLVGCTQTQTQTKTTDSQAQNVTTQATINSVDSTIENESESALDWDGVYLGILPCADCEGIEEKLTLNSDKSYQLIRTYYKNGTATVDKEVGTFVWLGARPVIKLTPQGDNSFYSIDSGRDGVGTYVNVHTQPSAKLASQSENSFYMIGEGYAKKLDLEGNPINSKLNYTLRKIN